MFLSRSPHFLKDILFKAVFNHLVYQFTYCMCVCAHTHTRQGSYVEVRGNLLGGDSQPF